MSLVSAPGAPLRKPPLAGRGAFPLSIAAMLEEGISVCEYVEDGATRLRVEDVVYVVGWMKDELWRMGVRLSYIDNGITMMLMRGVIRVRGEYQS